MPQGEESLDHSPTAAPVQACHGAIRGQKTILLVAPAAPPYGGMQLQAELLTKILRADSFRVIQVATNPRLPPSVRFIEKLRGVRPFARAALFCIRLWRELAETDVVHVLAASWLYFFLVVYPAVFLGRLRHKRVVLTYHGGEAERFLSSWAVLARPAFRVADTVAVPSGFLKQVLERHTRVPVSVCPNIVDLSAFPFRERPNLRPRILVTRHLEKIYDIASVIRAFQQVQACNPEASLWIAGTGSQEESLRSLVCDLRLSNVRFLGHVPYGNLSAVYDQCDIFVNASLADNFPGALLEASASGLVVISTKAGGIPFIYEDRKNALLVEVGDSVGLGMAIETVLRDSRLAANLTGEGLSLVRGLQWANIQNALFDMYDLPQDLTAGT